MQIHGWNIACPFISTRIPSIANSSIGWRSVREIFRLWMQITRKVLFLRNYILCYLKGSHLSSIIRQNPTLISRVHAITYATWNCSVIERCFVQWGQKVLAATKTDGLKSLYVAFPSAPTYSRDLCERLAFAIFASLLSTTQSRFARNGGSVRQQQRKTKKWHGTAKHRSSYFHRSKVE